MLDTVIFVRLKPVLYWYQLLNIPDQYWYQGFVFLFFFNTWQVLVSGTFLKLSYQLGTGIRSKADFCLVYGRYEPGIGHI